MAPGSIRAGTRWVSRIIPAILAGIVGFTVYVVVARLCVQYLLQDRDDTGTAIAILVLHFVFLALMIATYLRTLIVINTTPGLVPLSPVAEERRGKKGRNQDDVEAHQYNPNPDLSPDSPGLEQFYTKDVFVASNDGRPVWCSVCGNWKPDRSHHSSEMARCVRKMDHYCPWVGGIVSETSFKFFVQFTFYTVLYCAVVLGIAAYVLSLQVTHGLVLDGFVIAAIGLSAFFGLFTFMMTATSLRFIFINMTNVDVIRHSSKVYQLAIRIPRGSQPTSQYGIINYPLSKHNPPPDSHVSSQNTESSRSTVEEAQSARDQLATRTFAVVKTEMGENIWDLGFYQNWVSVMGTNIFDWFLPIRDSPCCHEENHESFYRLGPVYQKVRRRYNLPELPASEAGEAGIEMREVSRANRHADEGAETDARAPS